MYRIYLQRRQGGWEGPFYNANLEKLQKKAYSLSPMEYYSYMIINNDGTGDDLIEGR